MSKRVFFTHEFYELYISLAQLRHNDVIHQRKPFISYINIITVKPLHKKLQEKEIRQFSTIFEGDGYLNRAFNFLHS